MLCHEVDYQIIGDDIQAVEVELDPGETVIAEAGAMNYMEQGIDFQTTMGDGSRASQSFASEWPEGVPAGEFLTLSADEDVCAIGVDDTVTCWGVGADQPPPGFP